ncbi:MAG: hypothetical protein LBI59_11600 [Candidatus Accumulibacter sp.]|jgi:hypothetical protein|nr:hypothetical protein [Accumulibacter sp.]
MIVLGDLCPQRLGAFREIHSDLPDPETMKTCFSSKKEKFYLFPIIGPDVLPDRRTRKTGKNIPITDSCPVTPIKRTIPAMARCKTGTKQHPGRSMAARAGIHRPCGGMQRIYVLEAAGSIMKVECRRIDDFSA